MNFMRRFIALTISIAIAQAAGLIGSLFTITSIPTWFAALDKPWFSPPNWIFGPVWTLLYTLMGIAAFLIYRQRKHPQAKQAMVAYSVQLTLNAAWSIIFFGSHAIGLALVEIIAMWAAIVWTIALFARVDRRAAWILVPYLAWVSFATMLNAALWRLNA